MRTHSQGRHENGQNFLTHSPTIARIAELTAATQGPLVEIGPGDGALTMPLSRSHRPMTAIEIDRRLAQRLQDRVPEHVRVLHEDFLQHRLPRTPHVLVGNLPFHLTTAMLRRILRSPGWTDAVLITQWEVARRRAGVGRASMMTAQWAPWFAFDLHGRVPARAFAPRPGVDGGILSIQRIRDPSIPAPERRRFQELVHRVYTGPGRGVAQVLARTTSLGSTAAARSWLAGHGIGPDALPGDIPGEAWVDLFRTVGPPAPRKKGTSGPMRERGRGRGRG